MDKQIVFTVTFTDRDLPGVFDMMRYEGSTVESWDHLSKEASPTRNRDWWRLQLRASRGSHVPDRWHSFGLTAVEVP